MGYFWTDYGSGIRDDDDYEYEYEHEHEHDKHIGHRDDDWASVYIDNEYLDYWNHRNGDYRNDIKHNLSDNH